jgi:hypothetical protein
MITILTWLWEQPGGRTKFTMEHVAIWADMVRRNLKMPHRLACVTNMKGLPSDIERIAPPGDFENIISQRWGNGRPNCFRRLSMFRRDAAEIFGERFVCMDLDCVVGGELDPLFKRDDDLVLFRGTHADRPYNGSLMLIRAGCRPQVYENFSQLGADESGAKFCGSDQAWLAHCLGWGEKTWYERHGVYHYGSLYNSLRKSSNQAGRIANLKILFFPGKMKPWTLAEMKIDKFVTANYRQRMREAA